MPNVDTYAPGSFCWYELATSDQAAAKTFYTSLFGWSADDQPMGEGEAYTMMRMAGRDVGGVYRMHKEQADMGVPPHWLNYIAVADADAAAARAKELGAAALVEPFDVFDIGRMAVLRDPQGATFAIWQAKTHIGTGIAMEPGTPCWTELLTRDRPAAKAFYTALFGWTTKADDTEYTEFVMADRSFAGMMDIKSEWGPMPSAWGVYFQVEHCDGIVERAKELAANVYVPPTDIANVGRFASIADPQGAMFSVVQMTTPM